MTCEGQKISRLGSFYYLIKLFENKSFKQMIVELEKFYHVQKHFVIDM